MRSGALTMIMHEPGGPAAPRITTAGAPSNSPIANRGAVKVHPGAMHVLVTGGLGFIGSFVVERLLAAGHAVRVLDNADPQAHPSGPPDAPAGVDVRRADVRDGGACARALD